MTPTSSPKMEPFLPWVVVGTALVVATLLILGVSNQYSEHFQKLYRTYFTRDEKDFAVDFTLTLGTYRSGADLLAALIEEKCMVSLWSRQALENPDFPVATEEITVGIVVVSMREMGFAAGELATLNTIYSRARQMGFETCPVETAAQLRLQFLDQPDWTTRERLGEFFVGSEPFVLTDDGFPKIFSVIQDDESPHVETGIGLWLISNGTVEAEAVGHPDRLFNASDPVGTDLGGRLAFVVPK